MMAIFNVGSAQFYSGADTFASDTLPDDAEIDKTLEKLRWDTHMRELEKSSHLGKMIYANPVLVAAKEKGVVVHELKAPLMYRLRETKAIWRYAMCDRMQPIYWRFIRFFYRMLDAYRRWNGRSA